MVDAEGRPIDIVLAPGQRHDGKAAPDFPEAPEQDASVLAEKAYVPAKRNRKKTFPFGERPYRYRNPAGRVFDKLRQFRGIATRYGKNPENFLAAIDLA